MQYFLEKKNKIREEIILNTDKFEIERKYLIKMPCESALESMNIISKSKIEQIYLTPTPTRPNARIRKRVFKEATEYTTTQKIRINDVKRIEDERVISFEEYENLKKEADISVNTINKIRIVAEYNNQYFEIDIYDFWNDVAVMEIELESENQKIEFPPIIKILTELTSDKRFSNHSMAKKIPDISEYI